jgi:hypothetical protein
VIIPPSAAVPVTIEPAPELPWSLPPVVPLEPELDPPPLPLPPPVLPSLGAPIVPLPHPRNTTKNALGQTERAFILVSRSTTPGGRCFGGFYPPNYDLAELVAGAIG